MFKDNIAPFFWLHGEELSVLKTELDKVEESGISAICVESRPHPDFAGEKWWLDMDLLVGEAKKRGMKLWLLDDCRFPTGFANGAFAERASDKANLFLTIHVRDAVGPLTGGVILLDSILKNAEEIVAVTAYRRADLDSTELSEESFDLTDKIVNGCIRWDVPEGLWRVCTAYTTHKGVGRKDYFNILDSSSVRVLLDEVYEPHYKRYGAEFGKTFMGFFSDEPEFANVSGYDFQARLGEKMRFIPWSGELEARLKTAWGEAFPSMLPLLWYNSASLSRHARYDFMQAVTRQLQVSFSAQVAGWCEEHGVSHIGHIIEDDNVHARLGCSTGHYFRSLSGMRMAGIDVVLLQIMPGFTGTIHQWVASDRDGEFFHFGLAKLCASLAHIDPKKRGDALCEIFGAYGWHEGLRLMKWLVDHMLVRGVNWFVPHGFSPKMFPDPDCPPHFYAGGNHAQFKHFGKLMTYARRGGTLLSGGKYMADAAVLYHAESEWAGNAMPFQKPVRELTENQIGCDVLPADVFGGDNFFPADYPMSVSGGTLTVNGVDYRVLVLPYAEYIPIAVVNFTLSDAARDLPVYITDALPVGICEKVDNGDELLKRLAEKVTVVPLRELAGKIRESLPITVRTDNCAPMLRAYPYCGADGGVTVCFFNEDTVDAVDTSVALRLPRVSAAVWYDAWQDRAFTVAVSSSVSNGETEAVFHLRLEPGELKYLVLDGNENNTEPGFMMFGGEARGVEAPPDKIGLSRKVLTNWRILTSDVKDGQIFTPLCEAAGDTPPPDLTDWLIEHRFSGVIRYVTEFACEKASRGILTLTGPLDTAEVTVNGEPVGVRICPPYQYGISLRQGNNQITIELPVTPVWKVRDAFSALCVIEPFGLRPFPEITLCE